MGAHVTVYIVLLTAFQLSGSEALLAEFSHALPLLQARPRQLVSKKLGCKSSQSIGDYILVDAKM